jgi:predicted TIM-barrel fold metal-dependent hydrolase
MALRAKIRHTCEAMKRFAVRLLCAIACFTSQADAQNTRETATYQRIKASLDAVPAIDTHDHLFPFEMLPGFVETPRGPGMTLASLWRNSYLGWIHRFPAWPASGSFDEWWSAAKGGFDEVRATSFYRYTQIAIQDLYGVDFGTITDAQAHAVNERVFDNYKDQRWLFHVITERANIELMFNDPHWAPLDFETHYPFEVLVFRVNSLIRGFHPSRLTKLSENPYVFAKKEGVEVKTFDDYLALLDVMFQRAKAAGAACLKTTVAYERSLRFENVTKEAAARAFGRPPDQVSAHEIQDFEDFIMWRLCELSAKYELPFQIHTGDARIQGSNPMLLVDLMAANPKTKFILFHGGYPWIGETGVIVMKAMQTSRNVWIDSVWLPTISTSAAKRAFHEWLEIMPSDRIMWGGDCNHAEGIYGATELTRRCVAEVLSEKVDRGDLKEKDAVQIGRNILRENALALFPQLRERLWKDKGKLEPINSKR